MASTTCAAAGDPAGGQFPVMCYPGCSIRRRGAPRMRSMRRAGLGPRRSDDATFVFHQHVAHVLLHHLLGHGRHRRAGVTPDEMGLGDVACGGRREVPTGCHGPHDVSFGDDPGHTVTVGDGQRADIGSNERRGDLPHVGMR